MLVRDIKRLALFLVPLFTLMLISYGLWDSEGAGEGSWWHRANASASAFLGGTSTAAGENNDQQPPQAPLQGENSPQSQPLPPPSPPLVSPPSSSSISHSNGDAATGQDGKGKGKGNENGSGTGSGGRAHSEISSLSTPDGKYFPVRFGNESAFNPNIIPHPTRDGVYIIVGQKVSDDSDPMGVFFEVACDAAFFEDGALQCLEEAPVRRLPIAPTDTANASKCDGGVLELTLLNRGPHDARVFYGPERLYVVFGSNSGFTCFGMWMQDFGALWGGVEGFGSGKIGGLDFAGATELQRPPPWSAMEKNWFIFWDRDGQAYVHYDASPTRRFAKLNPNGAVGPNLGPFSAEQDDRCLAHYLPRLPEENEDIHQAANSLRVTMCKRADKECMADETNTFLVTIIQHKTWYHYHGEYEPYVMVFRERSPFELYGISKLPLWINGRQRYDNGTTDMIFVVSMNWKTRGVNYHGYLDDELLVGFGIDDNRSGAIDIRASDLLTGLGLCSDV